MPDRKEIISALEYLIEEDCTDTQHDYVEEIEGAIALLREQEPVEPIRKRETGTQRCGICGTFICSPPNRYCPNCGRKVKR